MAETINNKEKLCDDEIYRLRVGNKQKTYRDLLGIGPNIEPGFFLPIDYYQSQLGKLTDDLSNDDYKAEFKLLKYHNRPNEYVDGFQIDTENRHFIIMRDSFFEDKEDLNISLVNAETIVLSILDESEWPHYNDNKFSRVHEYVAGLSKVGNIDDLTVLALALDLGDKPKEFLGSPIYKSGHNAYWNLLVKKTIESCGVDDVQELKVILSTIGLTTINTSPRISEIDNPDINIRTEIDSLKEAIQKYQGSRDR
ncbi:MAG: hypothetical protein WBI29_02350 [Candidatus Saccharimonadales bacterium]